MKTISLWAGLFRRFGTTRKPRRQRRQSIQRAAIESLETRLLLSATYQVDALGDVVDGDYSAGNLSLREAILLSEANAGTDLISFHSSLAGQEILLTQGQFAIADNLGITGLAGLTIRQTTTQSRIFEITGNLSIENLTLAGGSVSGNGGAIRNAGGVVTIRGGIFTGNSATSNGGAISNEGGSLSVTSSSLVDNTSGSDGGAVYNSGMGAIAGLHTSTFSGNSARFGGAISNYTGATLSIFNTTLSGNRAVVNGGAIDANSGQVGVNNSTMTGNRAGTNGYAEAIGGGIRNFNAIFTMHGVILAGNTQNAGTVANEAANQTAFDSLSSYNLIGDAASADGISNGVNANIVGVDWTTVLAPTLANNGGPTLTHGLLSGSAAISAGNPSYNNPYFPFDQRGTGFPRVMGGRIDIGAIEWGGSPTDIVLSASSVEERLPIGVLVGTLSTTDADVGDSFTFTLVDTENYPDNAAFTLGGSGGNQLKTNAVLDYETKSSYSIRVRTTDSTGLSFEKTLAITVLDIDETPAPLSTTTTQINADTTSTTLSISGDGRFVAYTKTDTNGRAGVFLKDRETGVLQRVSISSGGELANSDCSNPVISADGRYVAFLSYANNLVAGDTNNHWDVFVHDRQTGVTTRVSVHTNGTQANFYTLMQPSISADGRFISFQSDSTSLTDHGVGGVFVHDLMMHTTTLVSVHSNGTPGGGGSYLGQSISANGRYVTFQSSASNLVDGDTNSAADIFVHDRETGATTRVSVGLNGQQTNDWSRYPSISGDGRFVAFHSHASNLVEGDTNNAGDIFVYDRNTGVTTRVSVHSNGSQTVGTGSHPSNGPEISQDGRYVTFVSDAKDLVDVELVPSSSVFVHDRNTGITSVAHLNNQGVPFGYSSYSPAISADGFHIVFANQASGVLVRSLNFSPTDLQIDQATVPENSPVGTLVGTLTATDSDLGDVLQYQLVAGEGSTDNASFTIFGSQLKTASSFNYEVKNSYSIRVRVTDQGGLTYEKIFTIQVTDVNEAPTVLALASTSVEENQPVGTTVGTLTGTDPDAGSTFTYMLAAGTGSTDNGSFTIVGNQLKSNAIFDFETKSSYSIRVRVTDNGGLTLIKIFTITVSRSNRAPTALALSSISVPENQATGTVVGTFITTDPNAGNTFTYMLAAGTGDTDNASFTVAGNQLRTAGTFNFEAKNSYSIRVRVTDNGGLTLIKIFTISVTNVNEAPTALALSTTVVEDSQPIGTTVGTFSATDPDVGSTFTYMLAAGTGSTDNGSFTIVGNQLKTNEVFNAATKSSYSIRVRVTDNGGLTLIKIFTITVVPKNLAPTALALSSTMIMENQPVGTTVGTFSTTDPNPGNTFTYMLAAGTGSTDNGSFTIVGNQLKTGEVFNFATKSSYSIRVRVTDNGGFTLIKIFTITVNKTNHAPTVLALSSTIVADNQPIGTTVGTFSATDPDAGSTFTYMLAAGTGSTDNGSFTIVGNQLKTNAVFDFEAKKSYSIRVRVTDNGGSTLIKIFTISVTDVAD